jgi:hypothetical protein
MEEVFPSYWGNDYQAEDKPAKDALPKVRHASAATPRDSKPSDAASVLPTSFNPLALASGFNPLATPVERRKSSAAPDPVTGLPVPPGPTGAGDVASPTDAQPPEAPGAEGKAEDGVEESKAGEPRRPANKKDKKKQMHFIFALCLVYIGECEAMPRRVTQTSHPGFFCVLHDSCATSDDQGHGEQEEEDAGDREAGRRGARVERRRRGHRAEALQALQAPPHPPRGKPFCPRSCQVNPHLVTMYGLS